MSKSHRPLSSQIRPNRKSYVQSRAISVSKALKPLANATGSTQLNESNVYMKKIIALKRKYLHIPAESSFASDIGKGYSPISELGIFYEKKLNQMPGQLSQRLEKSLRKYQSPSTKKDHGKEKKFINISPKRKRSIISMLDSVESPDKTLEGLAKMTTTRQKPVNGSRIKVNKRNQNKYFETPKQRTPNFLCDKFTSGKFQDQLNVFPLQLAQILTSFGKKNEKELIKDIHRSIDVTKRQIKQDISRVVDELKQQLFSLIDTKLNRVVDTVTPKKLR